jgi:hypothetical protein
MARLDTAGCLLNGVMASTERRQCLTLMLSYSLTPCPQSQRAYFLGNRARGLCFWDAPREERIEGKREGPCAGRGPFCGGGVLLGCVLSKCNDSGARHFGGRGWGGEVGHCCC